MTVSYIQNSLFYVKNNSLAEFRREKVYDFSVEGMVEVVVILIKNSALCDFARKEFLEKVKNLPNLKVTFLDYDSDFEAIEKMNIKIDGLPAFFILDDKGNLLKEFIGGDPKTIENIVNELMKIENLEK